MSEPKRTIGNSNTPFSYRTNPEWETWAVKRIEELKDELEDAWTRAENAARAYRKMKHENKRLRELLPESLAGLLDDCQRENKRLDAKLKQSYCNEYLLEIKEENKRLQTFLNDAWQRMDRARDILTDSNSRPECNWGMLDTKLDREAYEDRSE